MINEHVSLVLKEMLESALYKNISIKEGKNQSYLILPKRFDWSMIHGETGVPDIVGIKHSLSNPYVQHSTRQTENVNFVQQYWSDFAHCSSSINNCTHSY